MPFVPPVAVSIASAIVRSVAGVWVDSTLQTAAIVAGAVTGAAGRADVSPALEPAVVEEPMRLVRGGGRPVPMSVRPDLHVVVGHGAKVSSPSH